MARKPPAGPAIVVHSLDHARLALAAAAELETPVTLLSAPGAALYAGPAWFRKIVELAAAEFPDAFYAAVLDCGDRPGAAMAAFRHGLAYVRYDGTKATRDKLRAIAAQTGAHLLTRNLRALDLAGERDPATACRAWLAKRRARPAKRD